MPPCPYCESENVIRTDTFHLEYECLDCRQDWTDWVDQDEWWSPNMRHSFLSHDDGTPGFISGNWGCMYCGDPDR